MLSFQKTKITGLLGSEISSMICLAVCTQYRSVGDRRRMTMMGACCQGVSSTRLTAAANSIACTVDNNALLGRLFNMTSSDVRVISQSTEACRAAYARCERCLHHDLCQVNGTSSAVTLQTQSQTIIVFPLHNAWHVCHTQRSLNILRFVYSSALNF